MNSRRIAANGITGQGSAVLLVLAASFLWLPFCRAAESQTPFADAVAVWHFQDLKDSAASGGEFKSLAGDASADDRKVRIRSADVAGQAVLSGLPVNGRFQLLLQVRAAGVGLRFRASGARADGRELQFPPTERKVWLIDGQSLAGVDGFDQPITLDIILKGNFLDMCINGQRTLINWITDKPGDFLVLSVENGEAIFEEIPARPLK